MTYPALSSLVVFCLLVRWIWTTARKRQLEKALEIEHGCQPLKPWKSDWPLGLDLLYKAFQYSKKERILQFFLHVVEDSGTTFEQNLLGARGIDTIDPQNIEAVLSTDFANYDLGLRPPTFHPLLGSGIFTQDGAAWKHSRQLLRPQFSSNRYQNFLQIQNCVQQLIQTIPSNGKVDLQPLFFKLTFDTTMFLLFGDAVSAMDWGAVSGQETTFARAFNTAQDYLAHRGRLGDLYWLLNTNEFRKACETCHQFVDFAVERAIEASATDSTSGDDLDEANYVFIDALIKQTQDKRVLRDQCLNVLLAGRDTTGCCLTWTFRLLARHQSVLHRLREEVEQTCGLGLNAELPTREQLKQMTYLNLVIKEVLRLYPSVPVNSRSATKMTTLPTGGGPDGTSPILVRPGEAVGYCVYAMHRRKDIYGDDALEFRPERWEGDALKNIGWAYLPFNGGPRICLGQEFALLEVAYTVARLVQVFPDIKVPGNEPMVGVGEERQTLTLVVACADGCRVALGQDTPTTSSE